MRCPQTAGAGGSKQCWHAPRDAVRGSVARRSGSTGFLSSRSFPMSPSSLATALVVPLEQLRMTDVEAVGGKNASLGEMISQLAGSGVRVPGGFATTAHAFRQFLAEGALAKRIGERLARLDTDD